MGVSVEYLGGVVAALVGRDIGVVAFNVEGQPMCPAAAFHADPLQQNWGHRIAHAPHIDVRIARAAALPHLALVGGPANPVQQPGFAGRMLSKAGGDDPAAPELGNLHPPQASHVVHHVAAHAIDRKGPKNAGVRADAGDGVALRIDQIQVFPASVLGLALLKEWPR